MTFTRRAQLTTICAFLCVLAAVYVFAWSLPAVGLGSDDGAYLVTARSIATGHGYRIESMPHPVAQTSFPPLFPYILALFTLVSMQTQWLKLLPLICCAGWLALTRNLLLKMGASQNAALLLIALAAASPTVVYMGTNLLPESLFALLGTAALLALLEERAAPAGILAGLATLTRTGGIALIVACILTLASRRRFRGAALFAGFAMLIAAPWFGWSLAHFSYDTARVPLEIFTSLAASEKLVVLFQNFLSLLASPFSLLAGFNNPYFVIGTLVLLARSLWVRRQLVPDLFVAFYSIFLLFWISPPAQYVAPILPLFLWMIWRAIRSMRNREALAALVLIVFGIPLAADAVRILPAHTAGGFAREGGPADNWHDMRTLFQFIRATTGADDVLLANLDSTFYLNTGRKTVRGFAPNYFDLYYLKRQSAVTPDQLSRTIAEEHVTWLVLTPDRGLAESPSFHDSVGALERGGVIDPVTVPGLARDYRLFRVMAR